MSQEGKEKCGEGVEKERKKRKKEQKKIILSSSLSVEIMFGELYTFDLCSIL